MENVISKSKLDSLLVEHKTPFYFYNSQELRKSISSIRDAFPLSEFQLLFATMANDLPEFLAQVHHMNVGACINSIKHLDLVQCCGFENNQIQFTSTGLSESDMRILLSKSITVNFDSLSQLKKWFSMRPGLSAGIRINAASLANEVPIRDRLGIEKGELNKAIEVAKLHGGIVNGIHVYVGTNYKNPNQMLPPIRAFIELASRLPDLEYVNIGGGIGVNYFFDEQDFDLNEYGQRVSELVIQLRNRLGKEIKLVFEPGRRLAASSGVFVTTVTDIKILNNSRYVVVDGSVAVFPRPLHHPESPHRVFTPHKNGTNGYVDSIIVGRTTFSKDILSTITLPKDLTIGDVIVFDQAGAYCDSMRSRFLGQQEPLNILT